MRVRFMLLFFSGICLGFSLGLLFPFLVSAQEAEQSVTLASFETTYGDYGRYRGRAHNIRQASSTISEVVLQPSEQFSFNESVGERTWDNGFRRAPVIVSGRLVRGLGGGICQLASTIYAAAMYSGLEIVEHHAHSRTSGYIRSGLDATVDWGTKDLIIRNSFPFPVTMRVATRAGARDAEEVVSVEFTSRHERVYDVSIRFRRQQVGGFDTIEEVDTRLGPGERRVDEPGTPAMRVTVWRRLTPVVPLMTPIRERRAFNYPASNRIILVGLNL